MREVPNPGGQAKVGSLGIDMFSNKISVTSKDESPDYGKGFSGKKAEVSKFARMQTLAVNEK